MLLHIWEICIPRIVQAKQILIGRFVECQSIKKVGGRRSVEELYQALFFVSPFPPECFTERNENRAWSQVKSTAVLPYIKGVSERVLRRCLQQQGVRTVFKSDTTLRSHLVRPKDTLEPTKQDGVVYKIPCECGKVYISGKQGERCKTG